MQNIGQRKFGKNTISHTLIAKNLPQKSIILYKRKKDTDEVMNKWSKNIILNEGDSIKGDSMISGVNKYYLSSKGRKVKVWHLTGLTTEDMFDYLKHSHAKRNSMETAQLLLFILCSRLDQCPVFPQGNKIQWEVSITSLNIKFWKKYSKKPRLCFKISQGIPE